MKPHPTIPHLYLDGQGRFFLELVPSTPRGDYPVLTIPRYGRERVHRLVWEITRGRSVPRGKCVRHRNDERRDATPTNLVLGTQRQNVADAVRNGRKIGSPGKLTSDERRVIRRRRKKGERLASLASEFQISVQRVCDIAHGR